MTTFLTIVHVLICLFLIAVVLLQSGRAGGMGVLSGAATQTVFGGRGASNFLQKLTTACAIMFMLTCAGLAWYSSSAHNSPKNKVIKPLATTPIADAGTAAADAGVNVAALFADVFIPPLPVAADVQVVPTAVLGDAEAANAEAGALVASDAAASTETADGAAAPLASSDAGAEPTVAADTGAAPTAANPTAPILAVDAGVAEPNVAARPTVDPRVAPRPTAVHADAGAHATSDAH